MEQVKLGFDLHQIHSLATTPAESPDVTNNTAMVYDAEIRSIEKRDQSNDNEKEEQHKTEETGMSNEELMEQNDDGESRVFIFTIMKYDMQFYVYLSIILHYIYF